MDRIDRIGSNKTDFDQNGPNKTNFDRNGPKWIESNQNWSKLELLRFLKNN